MPIYTCTIRESTLGTDTKAALAREMARIHSPVNHVPNSERRMRRYIEAQVSWLNSSRQCDPVTVILGALSDSGDRSARA